MISFLEDNISRQSFLTKAKIAVDVEQLPLVVLKHETCRIKRACKILLCHLFNKCSAIKGAVSRNSAKLGNYKMPVKLRET